MKCLPLDSIKWVDINGYFTWESLKDKCLRSFNDQPALVTVISHHSYILYWLKENEFHRGYDRPAIIDPDGSKKWYSEDRLIKKEDHNGNILYYSDIESDL